MNDRITPCFWFSGTAQEAVDFYVSLFDDSRVTSTTFYGQGAPMPEGSVMTVQFQLCGRDHMAINGPPQFQFSPAISMVIYCDSQEELDRYWDALSEGGSTQACGWLTDRFGVSWQVVPSILPKLMSGPEEQSARVMQKLWSMVRLDIAQLEAAANSSSDS